MALARHHVGSPRCCFFHLFHVVLDLRRFKNTYQSGFLSILYSIGSKPLQIWDKKAIRANRDVILKGL